MEILNEYGADAMRLYLITSPVVRGDNLAFKKQGVFDVIRNVFLPWYNAYRFLVQNVLRCEGEAGTSVDLTQVRADTPQSATPQVAFCMASRAQMLASLVKRMLRFGQVSPCGWGRLSILCALSCCALAGGAVVNC